MRALTAGGESAAPTTPDMQSPPSHDDGIDTSRHRSTSAPPPKYTRDSAEDDPFRDGDTPVGFYYHEKRGIDERLSAATPNRMDSPQPTSYPIREPTVVNADLDEEPLPLPARPVPSRGPGPMRGLQVPSRTSIITWGFKLPPILVEQGVTKAHWKMFTTELKSFAAMSKTQWSTVFVAGAVVSAFVAVPLPFIGHFITPSCMLNYKMQKHREHRNLFGAHCAGLLEPFLARWNNDYFGPLGLHIRIDPPGVGRMENMDVASTQHFRLLQKMGKSSTAPGTASGREKRKERRYQLREGHQRVKAARKCRIVVMPFSGVSVPDTTQVEPIQIGTLDREDSSDDGDSGIRVDAPTPSHVRVNTTHWGGGLDGDVSDRATTEEQGAEELDLDVLHASEDDAQPVAES